MPPPKNTPSPHSFVDIIKEIDHGKLERLLDEQYKRVVKAVVDTNQTGTLTLKLKVKVENGTIIAVIPDSRVNIPCAKVNGQNFFTDVDGGVHDEDTRQLNLRPLVDVNKPPGGN